ncbi:MAG: tRNA pseudouridine(55) synthase TruB [bacterium]
MSSGDPFDGILLVDKPAGPTSHDVVHHIRRHFKLKKVGHGGTLDPAATGLLVILLGRGTRVSNRFMSSDKTYEGTLRLGITTDSQDADGNILREMDPSEITREQLEAAMAPFKGDMFQTPPMVSAVRINGVQLYKLARQGEEVERKPRFIHLFEFRLLNFTPPYASFVLRCSKGTYVRTICHDIGEALGVGAHLSQLRRTESAGYDVRQATPFEALLSMNQVDLLDVVLPLHTLSVRDTST